MSKSAPVDALRQDALRLSSLSHCFSSSIVGVEGYLDDLRRVTIEGMARISLHLNDMGEVVLHWDEPPDVSRPPLQKLEIIQALQAQGYGDYARDDKAIESFLQAQQRQGREIRLITIARKVEGKILLHCTHDGLQAWLEVTPSKGCPPPTLERVKAVLSSEGVCYGLKAEVLHQFQEQGFLKKSLVAEGVPMIQGKHTVFEFLCHQDFSQKTSLDALKSIDHKVKNRFVSVTEDTPLMRKYPAVPGQAGKNIYGEVLQPHEVKDLPLQTAPGSTVSEQDPCLLVATRAGQPIAMRQTVRVDPILHLSGVNYDTGHIDFRGSVYVKGDVAEGFNIKADGDVRVDGTVEDAVIEAQNHILVNGSVFGKSRALLKAGGNIMATYVQNAHIECLGNLQVKNGLFFSHAKVLGSVVVGADQGHGRLHGGEIWAGKDLSARVVGSEAETQTAIYLGEDPYLREQVKNLEVALKAQQNHLQELLKAMIYLRTQGGGDPEKLQAIQEERAALLPSIQLMDHQIQQARENLKVSRFHCRLRASEKVYSGVSLRLMQVPRFVHEELGPAEFYLQENGKNWEVRVNL